jgi:hypothetical protein
LVAYGVIDREDVFDRTQEDPVTFLRLRALVIGPKIGVPVDVADRLVSIVISALGSQWLNEAAEDVPEAVPLPFRRHHLGHLIATAGEEQIGEILELGQYLEALHSVRGIPQVIQGLKSAYHQSLLQLAMAMRFKLAGALVTALEPPASDGRMSDIELEFEGVGYQAECYRPTYKAGNELAYELVRFAQGALDKTRGCASPYAIAIELVEAPTASLRKEAVAMVGRAIATLESSSVQSAGKIPAVILRGPGIVISVMPAPPTPPGSPPVLPRHPEFPRGDNSFASFMRINVARVSDLAGIYALPPSGIGTSCVGIWAPNEPSLRKTTDSRIIFERFGRKVEKKLVQARSEAGSTRILIVDAWEVDVWWKQARARLIVYGENWFGHTPMLERSY